MEMRPRRQMKEVLGTRRYSRSAQLAFAFAIGIPYRRVEYTTRERNQPDPWLIQRMLVPYDKDEIREELEKAVAEIKAWLETPAYPELVVKYVAARTRFMFAKQERAARIQAERACAPAAE